jgi:hypothetical protein
MSVLSDLFTQRVQGKAIKGPDEALIDRVKNLRRSAKTPNGTAPTLEVFFASRRIKEVVTDKGLNADGALVPLGNSFRDGFRMALRPDLSNSRIRFTVAHELCHTFFYEEVPEIKFEPHVPDPDEERLCNIGAAELLMPANHLRRQARGALVSLETLQELAHQYRVSFEAMFVRLLTLRLWKAELSVWRRMSNGSFAVKRVLGTRNHQWKWFDERVPNEVLRARANIVRAGHTFWVSDTPSGPRFRPVSYETKRHGDEVVVLVARKQVKRRAPAAPLRPSSTLFSFHI